MSFLTLFFELRGLPHYAAALTRSLLDAGASIGTLLGGVLNDAAARRSPSHGRIVVAQISVGSGIPLCAFAGRLKIWTVSVMSLSHPQHLACNSLRARAQARAR